MANNNPLFTKHAYYNNIFFNRWAWLYDYEKYVTKPLRQKAAKFLTTKPPVKLLDVASGTGAQAFELAKLGFDVTGIDLSPGMLSQAKKKCHPNLILQFEIADATDLPFKSHSFSVSSISLGLHDMPYEVEVAALREMKRVTKNSGEILIIDYMEPRKHWLAKISHPLILLYETKNYAPFIERGLDNLLKQAGLTIDRQTNFLGLAQIVIVRSV